MKLKIINFRIYDLEERKMLYGIIPISADVVIDPTAGREVYSDFSPPMQFTGMYEPEDLNKIVGIRFKKLKPIYDADILRMYEYSKIYRRPVPTEIYGIVKYNETLGKYILKCIDGNNWDYQYIQLKYIIKVEGNVWENMDIIKGLEGKVVEKKFKDYMDKNFGSNQ